MSTRVLGGPSENRPDDRRVDRLVPLLRGVADPHGEAWGGWEIDGNAFGRGMVICHDHDAAAHL